MWGGDFRWPPVGTLRWPCTFPARPEISTIVSLLPNDALFLLMSDDEVWLQRQFATPTSVELTQGWNNVCYAGVAKPASAAVASIAGQMDILYTLGSDQVWSRYVPSRPDVSSIDQLRPFEAVLIFVTQPSGANWAFYP